MTIKKTNCKHGLTPKQEVRARRIKDILIDPNKISERNEILERSIAEFRAKNGKNGVYETFLQYLKREDVILFSAISRSNISISDIIYPKK